MKNLVLVLFFILAVVNCKEKNAETNNTVESEQTDMREKMVPVVQKGCYRFDENGTTITFEVTEIANSVEGNLTYALSGKDKNTGTFKGRLKDDKLIGEYTFQSEGVESSREVAFMVKGDQLIEGYGELTDGGTAFKDLDAINYSSKMPLAKTDCSP